VLGAAGSIKDGADLGDDLAEVDLTDVGHGRQELGFGVAKECRADGTVEVGDRGQQGAQQPDLGVDELGERLGVQPDRWGGCGP